MDRERAETYLRLLAEAELRRAAATPAGRHPGRPMSARFKLVAQALTAVGAVSTEVVAEIQADVGLAVARRRALYQGGRDGCPHNDPDASGRRPRRDRGGWYRWVS